MDDIIISELEDAREQQRLNIPAKRLLEKLEPIPSNIEDLQRRWFWELLQNASDYNDSVDVVLELFKNKITFKHNGNPFRPIDTENLIAPDSGKDRDSNDESKTIGKFGTGFITTHILSSKIEVQGVIKSIKTDDYYSKFTLILDRTGYNNRDELKKSIKESSAGLDRNNNRIQYDSKKFNTSFSYDLDSPLPNVNPQSVVKKGLEYVIDVLPYALSFLAKVNSVTITNTDTDFIAYKKLIFSTLSRTENQIVVSVSEDDKTPTEITFRVFTEKSTQIIVHVNENNLIPYPKKITKLFCSLPMIGTEGFSFPVVVNSELFSPRTERDGINISANDIKNREALTNAVTAFKKLLDAFSYEAVKECFQLILLSADSIKNEEEKKWFKANITEKIKSNLLDAKIVETFSGMIILKNMCIPFIPKEN